MIPLAAVGKWLLGTQTGRGVLIGGSTTIGIAAGWFAFSTHYYNEGIAACEAKVLHAANRANVDQAETNDKRNATASTVANTAVKAGAAVVAKADKAADESKGVIADVYKKPPTTAPVSFDACVHPVDDRVQDRIGAAVRAANEAGD